MNKLPLHKRNYQIMVAGILVITLGFTLMAMDEEKHGFGFLGLTLGPIVVITGFVMQFFAIFYHSDKSK